MKEATYDAIVLAAISLTFGTIFVLVTFSIVGLVVR